MDAKDDDNWHDNVHDVRKLDKFIHLGNSNLSGSLENYTYSG